MAETKRAEGLEELAERAVDALNGEATDDAAQALIFAGAVLARRRIETMDEADAQAFIRWLATSLINVSGCNEGKHDPVALH